jgi:hypothetical protein
MDGINGFEIKLLNKKQFFRLEVSFGLMNWTVPERFRRSVRSYDELKTSSVWANAHISFRTIMQCFLAYRDGVR